MQTFVRRSPAATLPLRWDNLLWFAFVHAVAVIALWYLIFIHFSVATVVLAVVLFFLMHLSITVGMHRLYAHGAFTASKAVEVALLLLSAGVVQSSAIWWAASHRRHHRFSDTDRDPYSVIHGFWWAHMGWMLREPAEDPLRDARDLSKNRLVVWQKRNYTVIATLMAFVLPAALAALWGDWRGGLLVGGFLRLCVQYHTTWMINSVAHSFGTYRYDKRGTARTNGGIIALLTVGESYHQRHHLAPDDYRLGNRPGDIDPGKWVIWTLARLGFVSNLKTREESALIA